MESKDENETGFNLETSVKEGKNKDSLTCPRCPSIILNPQMADYQEIEHLLPAMTLRKDRTNDEVEMEALNQYWLVMDKFNFENIGFSNTVSGNKYLTCADCEIGPIGWFDPASQQCYVSVSRVRYKPQNLNTVIRNIFTSGFSGGS